MFSLQFLLCVWPSQTPKIFPPPWKECQKTPFFSLPSRRKKVTIREESVKLSPQILSCGEDFSRKNAWRFFSSRILRWNLAWLFFSPSEVPSVSKSVSCGPLFVPTQADFSRGFWGFTGMWTNISWVSWCKLLSSPTCLHTYHAVKRTLLD